MWSGGEWSGGDYYALSPEDRLKAVQEAWLAGMSASAIAAAMSAGGHRISRNVIVGFVNRHLKDVRRGSSHPTSQPPRKQRQFSKGRSSAEPASSGPRMDPAPLKEPAPPPSLEFSCGIMEMPLFGRCKFILNGHHERPKGDDVRYCGAPAAEAMGVWCDYHRGIVYEPSQSKRRWKPDDPRRVRLNARLALAREDL